MKARIPCTKQQHKVIISETQMLAKKAVEKERADLTRRLFKVMMLALHEQYGFGQQRCMNILGAFTELIKKSDTDEVYWEHIDRVVIDYLHLPFEHDYTSNGKVSKE